MASFYVVADDRLFRQLAETFLISGKFTRFWQNVVRG
jgi:hypothetical protein